MTSVRPNLKPDVPKSVTAWDARTGRTVYRTANGGWSVDYTDAVVQTGDEAENSLAEAKREEGIVVEPYFMEVTPDGEPAGRETLRETIRIDGPTHRDDVGRQANNN